MGDCGSLGCNVSVFRIKGSVVTLDTHVQLQYYQSLWQDCFADNITSTCVECEWDVMDSDACMLAVLYTVSECEFY